MPVQRRLICEIRQSPVTRQFLAYFTSFSLTPEREQPPFAVTSSAATGLGARDKLGIAGPPAVGVKPQVCKGTLQGLWGAGDIPSPSSLSPGGTYSQVQENGCPSHTWSVTGPSEAILQSIFSINQPLSTWVNTWRVLSYSLSFPQCLHLEMGDCGSSLYLSTAAAGVSVRKWEIWG